MSKNANKSSGRAKINWGWDAPEARNGKASRKTKNQVKNSIKKIGFAGVLIVLLFLILGCAVGGGAVYFVSRNDCFDILGKEEITLTIGESYIDEGVKIVSFGRDVSDNYKVDTNLTINENGTLTADEVGTYYIKYSVEDFKYGKLFTVEKIRLVTFVEETILDEVESEVQA